MKMKKEYAQALTFYLGKVWKKMLSQEMVKELNKKGFTFTFDMTLKEIFDKVYEKYLEEK